MRNKFAAKDVAGVVAFTFLYLGFCLYWWLSVHSLRRVIQLKRPIGLDWNRLLNEKELDVEEGFGEVFHYLETK